MVEIDQISFQPNFSCVRPGEVLIIWDGRVLKGVEVVLGSYLVSANFQGPEEGEWWLSGIYGLNSPRMREFSWEELYKLYG